MFSWGEFRGKCDGKNYSMLQLFPAGQKPQREAKSSPPDRLTIA